MQSETINQPGRSRANQLVSNINTKVISTECTCRNIEQVIKASKGNRFIRLVYRFTNSIDFEVVSNAEILNSILQ